MRLPAIVKALDACRGKGQWAEIAKAADLHYFTVARIARGEIRDPKGSTVDALGAAVRKVLRRGAAAT